MSLEQFNPLVTVYIPTYNRVDLLKRAVESVRQQTYQNLEIIIVDDCSTDNTHQYLEEASKQDSRIRYFIKEKNSGACVSRNIAIANAKGEFITGLDDDDYFSEKRIELFLNGYKKTKSKIQCSLYVEKCKNGDIIKTRFPYEYITYRHLLVQNYIGNQIFLHCSLKGFFYFDESVKVMQDLECWFRLLHNSKEKIICIKTHTYIIDKTHPHERISNTNYLGATNTIEKISGNIPFLERILLKNYIASYSGRKNLILRFYRVFYKLIILKLVKV
jgi:glycosyltransferase involved in cell wall biosynthesis